MTKPSSDNFKPDFDPGAAMTEPSSNILKRFDYPPESKFAMKLLDARIFSACDSESFIDELRECGLLEEYEGLQKLYLRDSDLRNSIEANRLGFGREREQLERELDRTNESFRRLLRILRGFTSSAEQLPQPPFLGEWLLVLFCPGKRATHVRGDLRENFNEDIKINGKRRAKLLYWAAVLRSIGPLLWVKLRRAGLTALLLEIGRRWSGLS